MTVYDNYSRRTREAQQTEPDVYQYDRIPETLRTQIGFIWDGAIGPYFVPFDPYSTRPDPPNNNAAWIFMRDAVCREKGRLNLANESNPKEDCIRYILTEEDVTEWLDLVEFSFQYIDRSVRERTSAERERRGIKQDPDDAINELNFRFRKAGLGYQYESGQIIRLDSELIHSEVVRPALRLLGDPRFAGPQEEFLAAHAHLRAGEYKDVNVDALNAFESTMKVICDTKGWDYPKGARASDLLKVVRANGLLPDYLDASYDQLIATLKSGLPRVRSEEGAHGQGGEIKETPHYIAAYALHLTAAQIVLLAEAFRASE